MKNIILLIIIILNINNINSKGLYEEQGPYKNFQKNNLNEYYQSGKNEAKVVSFDDFNVHFYFEGRYPLSNELMIKFSNSDGELIDSDRNSVFLTKYLKFQLNGFETCKINSKDIFTMISGNIEETDEIFYEILIINNIQYNKAQKKITYEVKTKEIYNFQNQDPEQNTYYIQKLQCKTYAFNTDLVFFSHQYQYFQNKDLQSQTSQKVDSNTQENAKMSNRNLLQNKTPGFQSFDLVLQVFDIQGLYVQNVYNLPQQVQNKNFQNFEWEITYETVNQNYTLQYFIVTNFKQETKNSTFSIDFYETSILNSTPVSRQFSMIKQQKGEVFDLKVFQSESGFQLVFTNVYPQVIKQYYKISSNGQILCQKNLLPNNVFNLHLWQQGTIIYYISLDKMGGYLHQLDTSDCESVQESITLPQMSYDSPKNSAYTFFVQNKSYPTQVQIQYNQNLDKEKQNNRQLLTTSSFEIDYCPFTCLLCSKTQRFSKAQARQQNQPICSKCAQGFELKDNDCVFVNIQLCENLWGKNCSTCNMETKTCKTCDMNQNRVLKNGACVCDQFYTENPTGDRTCIFATEDNESISAISSVTKGLADSSFYGSFFLLFIHPALFINLLDTLQYVTYLLFLQIDYPIIIREFFGYFDSFNFEVIGSFFPEHQNYMQAPKGFENNEMDAFFFRNIAQYMLITVVLVFVYLVLKGLDMYFQKQTKLSKFGKFISNGVNAGLQKFEYETFLLGIVGSFLTSNISSYLQINNIAIENVFQLNSLICSYILALVEIVVPFAILKISKDYLLILKSKNNDQKQIFLKKFSILFDDFKEKSFLQAGFYAIICFKKLFFAFILVFLNNQPLVSQILLILIHLAQVYYLYKIKPYKENVYMIRDMAQETLFGLAVILTVPFTTINREEIQESDLKLLCLVIIIVLSLLLIIEVIFILGELLLTFKQCFTRPIDFIQINKEFQQVVQKIQIAKLQTVKVLPNITEKKNSSNSSIGKNEQIIIDSLINNNPQIYGVNSQYMSSPKKLSNNSINNNNNNNVPSVNAQYAQENLNKA